MHADGLKIFGYQQIYDGQSNSDGVSTSKSGEEAVIDKIMAVKADGVIFDAESQWNNIASNNTVAESYGSYFKTRYATSLLGYETF